MNILYLFFLSILLTACGLFCDDTNKERSGLNQLSERISQWQENKILNYKLTYYVSCFCPNETKEVTVKDNEITKVEIFDREGELLREIPPEEYSEYYTISGFFERIKELNESVDVLKTEYNSSLGYPTVIDVDPYATQCNCDGSCSSAIDDEYTYHIAITINS